MPKKLIPGENDLASVNPKIAESWCHERNSDITPSMVSIGSHKKYWWQDELGHVWESTIPNRIAGNGCPYCSNSSVLPGFNDLPTTAPEMYLDWDHEKNTIDPITISKSSKVPCFWKCHLCGYEWEAPPRVRRGFGDMYIKKGLSIEEVSVLMGHASTAQRSTTIAERAKVT